MLTAIKRSRLLKTSKFTPKFHEIGWSSCSGVPIT